MADYPSYPQWRGSVEAVIDDLTVDTAVNGNSRARRFYSGPKRRFLLRHVLNDADSDALWAFYNANVTGSVTVTWIPTGMSYDCLFEGPPQPTYNIDGFGWTSFDVRLREL